MDRRRFLQQTGLCDGRRRLGSPPVFGRDRAGRRDAPAPASGPLRVHPENRRYFADASGRAVYLTGSHTWANIVDHGETDPPPEVRFRRLPRLPGPLRPQLHPALDLGTDRLGPGREGVGRAPAAHGPAAPVCPDRSRQGAGRQAKVRPDEVRPGVLRAAPQQGRGGRQAGDLHLGDALRGLGNPVRHQRLEAAPLPPRQQYQRHRRRRGPRRGHPHAQAPEDHRPSGNLRPQGRRYAQRPGQRALRDLQREPPAVDRVAVPRHPLREGVRTDQGEAASGGDDVPVQGREQQDAL